MSQVNSIFVLDNGAHTIKAGFAPTDEDRDAALARLTSQRRQKGPWNSKANKALAQQLEDQVDSRYECVTVPNSIARSVKDKVTYVADELAQCSDYGGSGVSYAGILTSWDCQRTIWDHVFDKMEVNPQETSLLVTEPYLNLPNVANTYDQMIFEEWEFASCYRCTPAALMPHSALFDEAEPLPPPARMLVVDAGYSFTHVIPVIDGQVDHAHIRRIDVGGKLLTNRLKQVLSHRQFDLSNESVRREPDQRRLLLCELGHHERRESIQVHAENPIVQQYALPDYTSGNMRGKVLTKGENAPIAADGMPAQVVTLGVERYSIPEILFGPSDIGLTQMGLAETIAYVIGQMPEDEQGLFWANIGFIGGLAYTDSLGNRLDKELRALCPAEYEVGIYEAEDPVTAAFYAAQSLAERPDYLAQYPLTIADYQEYGSSAWRKRFAAE
ncbi:hypothetical protein QFC20_003389 [Naganishia adeliensis]|uniref:Uncharacterized protein n=1 Tax=Naganishia adeliensis TaxID=92952 RepID=A0ACC2WAQ1_9TREE|nr:hypothetical protein QFC20_003389 [Naganishia adeliensis]